MWQVGQTVVIDFLGNQEFLVVKHMQGGMGDIFKVVDPKFISIAVKTLQPTINPSAFKQECEMLISASKGHACVKPIAYGIIDEHPAIAYHWHPTTLADHKADTWDASDIIDLIAKLADFFDYACSQVRILHCDIKPANILLDWEKNPYVSDFGISRIISSHSESGENRAAGTPAYMAPELVFTGTHTIKSELYSFGITIYEFLTGEHPYHNDLSASRGAKNILNQFKKIRTKLGDINSHITDFIERCISPEPSKRPVSFKLENQSFRKYNTDNATRPRTLIDSIAMQSVYFRKQGNFNVAENILLDGLEACGRHPVLLNALGNLYAISQSHDAAIVPLEEASDILLMADAKLDSLPYYDPIINLSMHYRRMGRHQDACNVLVNAWRTYSKIYDPPFLYSEFAWMHTYLGDYLIACLCAERCFEKRVIQPFEMLFFAQAAWSCRKLEKYADLILSKVVYNHQFEASCFLCAFILSSDATEPSIRRMYEHLDQQVIQQIERMEQENGMEASALRPPLTSNTKRAIMISIDHVVTGGRHASFIRRN